MKATGIVVEYNPFHYGHKLHLKLTQEMTNCDVIVAIMTPHFVQRGEPSVISKEMRVRQALDNGVNLIIELPFLYAVSNPDVFAFGALSMLSDMGVDSIVFGAESGPTKEFIDKYQQGGHLSPRLDEEIAFFLEQGSTYADSKKLALDQIAKYHLEIPNDILGYAYLSTINQYNLDISPLVIKRNSNDMKAQTLRQALENRENISVFSDQHFEDEDLHFLEDYFTILKFKIQTSTPEELRQIHLVDNGVEHLMLQHIKTSISMHDFISKCSSKRYSGARIKRTIIHILNNTSKSYAATTLKSKPPYIRILGCDSKGREYLASIRKTCTTPILNRFEGRRFPLLLEELKATSLYFILNHEPKRCQEHEKERSLFPIHHP